MRPLDTTIIAHALSHGGAIPFFQPIVHVDSPVISYEALGRISVDGMVLSPAQFLPLLENTPHQALFDRAIVIEAIRQSAEWHRNTGTHMHIHVNASMEALTDAGYAYLIREMLYTHKVPAETLTVEILETCSLFWENDRILETLSALRATGLRIAIDDFPTCTAPNILLDWIHHQLAQEFHILKLDRSIVTKACMEHKAGERGTVDEVLDYIDFAHTHGMRVVAEGVETAEDMRILEDLGTDELQGFAIGKPEPAHRAYHTIPHRHHSLAVHSEMLRV